MKRFSALLLLTCCLVWTHYASGQQGTIWTDEMQTSFRGQSISLGTSEEEFNRRYPGGFKTSVKTDIRELGSLPTVLVQGTWMLLDPDRTSKIGFIVKSGHIQEPGVFYFQFGKLVAMEIQRGIEPDQSDDMEPVIFQTLLSMAALGRGCSIAGLEGQSNLYSGPGNPSGESHDKRVRVACGRHYLTMSRTLMDYSQEKPWVAFGFSEGLIDPTAKMTRIPQPENSKARN
jgi:hypothetical protein